MRDFLNTDLGNLVRGGSAAEGELSGELCTAENGGCFLAGTLVATEHGHKPIETVREEDRVWAFDLVTGEWRLCRVAETYETDYIGEKIRIRVAGEWIESTRHHPVWVVEGKNLEERPRPNHVREAEIADASVAGRWVDAGDLQPGDVLLLKPDRRATVEAREVDLIAAKVYNFQVEGLHNYAVGFSDESKVAGTVVWRLRHMSMTVFDNQIAVIPPSITVTGTDGTGSSSMVAETDWVFNSLGELLSTTDADERTTTFAYNALNQQVLVTCPAPGTDDPTIETPTLEASATVATVYDTLGGVVSQLDTLGDGTTYAFDGFHNLASETDGDGNTTTFVQTRWAICSPKPTPTTIRRRSATTRSTARPDKASWSP